MGNDRVIAIRVRSDGTAEVIDDLDRLGKRTRGLGDDSEKAGLAGKTAFWGLGQAAEELGAKIGITGQANRRLGNTMEDLAARIPGLAMGFGIVTLAVGILTTVKGYLQDRMEKLREEVIKSGNALADEALGMEKNRTATASMEKARYQLYQITRELARRELEEAIEAQTQKIKDQVETINAGGTGWQKLARALNQVNIFSEDFFKNRTVAESWAAQTAEALKRPRTEMEKMVLELAKMRLKMKQLSRPEQSSSEFGGSRYATQLALTQQYMQAELALARAQGASLEEIQNRELSVFWQGIARKLAAIGESYASIEEKKRQHDALMAQADLEAQTLITTQQQQAFQMRLEAAQSMASNLSQTFQIMYQIGGNHARRWFTLYKLAAMSEAVISGINASIANFAKGSQLGGLPLGLAWAATSALLTGAKIAALRAQNFGSSAAPGGAGGGGYPTNASTGLPETQEKSASVSRITNIYVQGHVLDADGLLRLQADAERKAQDDNVYAY